MALAEARAVLHRTANRCLVQEDAKRAPKLACCSTVPCSAKQPNTVSSAFGGQDVPCAISMPFNLNPSISYISPNSKWWLHLQPNYGYQKGSMDGQFSSLEGSMEIRQKNESSATRARIEDNSGPMNQTTPKILSYANQGRNVTNGDKLDFGVKEYDGLGRFTSWDFPDPLKLEVKEDVKELKVDDTGPEGPKSSNEPCFDPKSSWIGVGKNAPWWRTADTDELASLVAQRSLDYIENCDLPMPQKTRVKGHDERSSSLPVPKHGGGGHRTYSSRLHTAGSLTSGSESQKLSVLAEGQSVSTTGTPLRDITSHETMVEMHTIENDASKAQLLEALCHSQTRAREAERAAKQACAEKEHVVKLVFRQASQLFAYKQWLQLLQFESMYLEFLNNSTQSVPLVFLTPQRTKAIQTTRRTPSSRKRNQQCHPQCEASKYAVVFSIGLGLAGAGFLLGCTIAWMFPSW